MNLLQLDVLVGLRRVDPRMTIVGDDAQAIYGFRGATAKFLLDAELYFNGLTTITLDINYRSAGSSLMLERHRRRRARRILLNPSRRGPGCGASQPLSCIALMNATSQKRCRPRPRTL